MQHQVHPYPPLAEPRASAPRRGIHEREAGDDEKQVMSYMLRHMATLADVSGRQMAARIVFANPRRPRAAGGWRCSDPALGRAQVLVMIGARVDDMTATISRAPGPAAFPAGVTVAQHLQS